MQTGIRKTREGFLEVIVTEDMLTRAQNRSNDNHALYGDKGTHRVDKPIQRTTGYVAEEAIKVAFPQLEFSSNKDVDFFYTKASTPISFDSKTNGTNTEPRKNYTAYIYEDQMHRRPRFYIFSRVSNDLSRVWIGGIISKNDFDEFSTYRPKGYKGRNFVYDEGRFEIQYDHVKVMRPDVFFKVVVPSWK
jgi:hypothetical protein